MEAGVPSTEPAAITLVVSFWSIEDVIENHSQDRDTEKHRHSEFPPKWSFRTPQAEEKHYSDNSKERGRYTEPDFSI